VCDLSSKCEGSGRGAITLRVPTPSLGHCHGPSMQWAMGLPAQATCETTATTTNAQWLLVCESRQKLSRLWIVAVLSRVVEEAFDLSMRPHGVAVHKRNGQMILSFLATVFRRVVARDGVAVCPDCSSRVTTYSDAILEAITNFEPSVTVKRTCRSSPPLKGESGVVQFAVCRSYIVRRCRTAEAKLLLESPNFATILDRIAHVIGCWV